MLKAIQINNQKVPVPVPLMTLPEAVAWVQETFVQEGKTITKVVLDGIEISDSTPPPRDQLKLDSASRLEVKVESAQELIGQMLEVIRNLASVSNSYLKPLAVKCWQLVPTAQAPELKGLMDDLALTLDLIRQLRELIDPTTMDMAAIQGVAALLDSATSQVHESIEARDYKRTARLLLNRIESYLQDLIQETETLGLRVMES